MKPEQKYCLLIGAMVAIVSIIGLVLYFGGANSGAVHIGQFNVARGVTQQPYVNAGTQVAAAYPGVGIESHEWCSSGCQQQCENQWDKSECNDICRSQCNYITRRALQIY